MMRKEVDLSLATRLINHGPVVLVSSLCDGKANVTPVAWTMPISKKPPMGALEIGQSHFIFDCIMKTKDFCVNTPSVDMAEKLVKCGSVSGRDIDKVAEFGLSLSGAKTVTSPALADAPAVLECVLVEDEHLIKEYNIIPAEVKYAEAEEGAFTDHWDFSKGVKTLHHLGNKTFCIPENNVIDLRQE